MPIQTIINCITIFIGAIIMTASIVKTKELLNTLQFIPERHRKQFKLSIVIHRGLMVLFLFGYVVVIFAFAFNLSLINETFVSPIFFFGAIFILIGTYIQSGLLFEMQSTLQGLLPICASCKKIRDDKGKWSQIEAYIRDHSEAEFSHSLCPECAKQIYPDYSEEDRK